METMKAGNKGYNAEILVVTYSLSKREVNESSKFLILLSFGQHGRELITSEVALRLISTISEETSIPDVDVSSVNDIFGKIVLKIVPMENLNGRKLVEAGDLCERRNGRGVDLNRNWSVDWGKKEKAAGVSIQGNFTQIQGRILAAPKLIVGNGENLVPRFGKWNFRGKKMVEPAKATLNRLLLQGTHQSHT